MPSGPVHSEADSLHSGEDVQYSTNCLSYNFCVIMCHITNNYRNCCAPAPFFFVRGKTLVAPPPPLPFLVFLFKGGLNLIYIYREHVFIFSDMIYIELKCDPKGKFTHEKNKTIMYKDQHRCDTCA